MRIRFLWLGILVALLVPALPAPAANQTVSTDGSKVFTPVNVTVIQGESVTWNNDSGSVTHNVHFDDNSFVSPAQPKSAMWTATRTFNTPGTYAYYCDAHKSEGMSGTVTVLGTGGNPGQPPPVAADKTAPALKLSGRDTQRVLRRRGVTVVVQVNEASTVTARATISVPSAAKVLRTKKASRRLAAGAKAKLQLGLSKKALRALRRALAKRPSLTARLTITATDTAGNTRSAKRRVLLTP